MCEETRATPDTTELLERIERLETEQRRLHDRVRTLETQFRDFIEGY